MATTVITASISTQFIGEAQISNACACQHKCHAPTLHRQGICDCCLIVGTTSFVLDCQRFLGCWVWMRMVVKPVGAADVQPGGALRSDRRPAEERRGSSINHEARVHARSESLSLQHMSLQYCRNNTEILARVVKSVSSEKKTRWCSYSIRMMQSFGYKSCRLN